MEPYGSALLRTKSVIFILFSSITALYHLPLTALVHNRSVTGARSTMVRLLFTENKRWRYPPVSFSFFAIYNITNSVANCIDSKCLRMRFLSDMLYVYAVDSLTRTSACLPIIKVPYTIQSLCIHGRIQSLILLSCFCVDASGASS